MASKFTYLLLIFLIGFSSNLFSQDNGVRRIGGRIQQIGSGFGGKSGGNDSLAHRSKYEDSITISFRYLDSSRSYKLDSSIRDFHRRYLVPATWVYMGNTGSAAHSLLFSPVLDAGFDHGMHAFDLYMYKVEKARFFNTTRPYSEINYLLGSRVEQIIELLHTQNLKPNWNAAFQYRLINSPGYFKSQKSNHNNYLLTSWFHSKNKRYNNYLAIVGNKMQSGENGGMQKRALLDSSVYKDRFNIPTRLGGDDPFSSNFFTTKINTGNKYNEFTVVLRQQYDLGKKDSLVTDSTVVPLFYPRLRFEHTLRIEQLKYTFQDYAGDSQYYYKKYYDTSLRKAFDTVIVRDFWRIFSNDFSIVQFPDAKNLQQFIKIGLLLQNISGEFSLGKKSFVNTSGHVEYRNKTRNQLWDIEANGKLYFTGFNRGDFQAAISLQRVISQKAGSIQVGFENASRTPSFIFDSRSSFYFLKTNTGFKKENNTHLFASWYLPVLKLNLAGHYYVCANYAYISSYYKLQQQSGLFNLLRIEIFKTFKLSGRWIWHTELYIQQKIGNAPINVPAIYSRNRIGYEGNLGLVNLDIAFGAEIKYRSSYKPADYSPVLGQFFYQDTVRISNRVPDISAYVHFRIRSFKAFVRAENLNTATYRKGFGFWNNNLVAPDYALPGLQIRVGVYWSFVN